MRSSGRVLLSVRGFLIAMLALVAGCKFRFDERADATVADCGHTFCDNFDRAGPPEATWSSIDTANAGVATFAQDVAMSPPSSLLVTLPVDIAMPTSHAMLAKQLPMATSSAVVDLWMSYATASTMNTEADLVQLKWDTPPPGCTTFGYYLVRDGTIPLDLQETYDAGCQTGGNFDNPTIILDNMPLQHVRLEITMTPSHLKLFVNDVSLIDQDAKHVITPSTLTLELGGAVVRNGQATWQVRYDDVLVDLQ